MRMIKITLVQKNGLTFRLSKAEEGEHHLGEAVEGFWLSESKTRTRNHHYGDS